MSNEKKTLNILVVDDEIDFRETIKSALAPLGHHVQLAGDGIEALGIVMDAKTSTNPVQLVISDIRMPKMTGIELVENLAKLKVPIILMTGFAKDFDFKQAEQIGACDLLKKPFSIDDLLNSIELVNHQIQTGKESEPVDLDHEYCRVQIDQFLSGTNAFQDVFLRLSQERYLRVGRAASPLSMERIQSYKKKGLNYLYIKKEDFANYVGFNISLAKAANTGRVPISDAAKLKLVRQTGEMYIQNIFVNGIDSESFEDGKVLTETAIQLLTESNSIYELLEMLRTHSDLIFAHSLGVSLYAALIAKQLGWVSPNIRFKISIAGILHDIGKKELPQELISKDRLDMSFEELKVYKTHPIRGRDILLKTPCVPDEVVQAVSQHHEDMSGMGFPLQLPRSKLHPIARLLYISDEFCGWCLTGPTGKGLDPKEALEKMYANKAETYDLEMLRALMEVMKYPVPDKLKNLKGKVGT